MVNKKKTAIVFGSIAGIALLVVGSVLANSEFAETRSCVEYKAQQRAAGHQQSDADGVLAGFQPHVVRRTDQQRAQQYAGDDQRQPVCAASALSSDEIIGLASLKLALYALIIALVFGVVALLSFYVSILPDGRGDDGAPDGARADGAGS